MHGSWVRSDVRQSKYARFGLHFPSKDSGEHNIPGYLSAAAKKSDIYP